MIIFPFRENLVETTVQRKIHMLGERKEKEIAKEREKKYVASMSGEPGVCV